MKRLIISLACLLVTLTVPAQDHYIRRQPKPAQQTTTKPAAKPTLKPTQKPAAKPSSKPVSKASPSSKRSNASLCPDGNHPHMIDLGLPSGTKWSCCNVGAAKPEAFGGYYAWGETETKSEYSWKTYKHYDGTDKTYHELGEDIAGTKYDVAHVKWGGSWVMPSKVQQDELRDNCAYTWTTLNGVRGGRFTSKKNGASIFLPAAGYRKLDDLYLAGSYGDYLLSSQYPSDSIYAYNLYFNSGTAVWFDDNRGNGHTVRPVSR